MTRRGPDLVREREVAGDLHEVWRRVEDEPARAEWLAEQLRPSGAALEQAPPRRLAWDDGRSGPLTVDLVPISERRTRVRLTVGAETGRVRRAQRDRDLVEALEASLRALDAQLRTSG